MTLESSPWGEDKEPLLEKRVGRKLNLLDQANRALALLVLSSFAINFVQGLHKEGEGETLEDKIENVSPDNHVKESESTLVGPGVRISKNRIKNVLLSNSTEESKSLNSGLGVNIFKNRIENVSLDDSERARLISKLRDSVGDSDVDLLLSSESVKDEAERREKVRNLPEVIIEDSVDGVLPGVKTEDIELFLRECIPQGSDIERVSYVNKKIKMPDGYGLNNDDDINYEAAHVDWPGKIVFSRGTKDDSSEYFLLDTLAHEAGHCADYVRNRYLTIDEKLCLQNMLIDRFQHKGLFKSVYVEKINNIDQKEETSNKICEYFAEIFAQYIKDKTGLPSEDRKIVEYVISRIDPDFDSRRASTVMAALKLKLSAQASIARGEDVESSEEEVRKLSSVIANSISISNQDLQ